MRAVAAGCDYNPVQILLADVPLDRGEIFLEAGSLEDAGVRNTGGFNRLVENFMDIQDAWLVGIIVCQCPAAGANKNTDSR